jgi:hypothetical protein
MRLLHTTGSGLEDIAKVENGNTQVNYASLLTAAVLRAADLAASCLRGALPRWNELRHW